MYQSIHLSIPSILSVSSLSLSSLTHIMPNPHIMPHNWLFGKVSCRYIDETDIH